jgi:hypothetical protein
LTSLVGFDAGIQFVEFIDQDMIAVRVSPDHRPAIVGSPECRVAALRTIVPV